jgi:multidrug efflux system membrane fusion protein
MKTKYILLILIILCSFSCRNRNVNIKPVETGRVKVTSIKKEYISLPVHSNGILVSSEELKLSFKTGGVIGKIMVREGERVRKGTLLASLDLSEIKANYDQAKNGYEKALRDYSRAENLFTDSVTTLEQKQNAATALDVARSALEIVQFNMSHSRIQAPSDGIVLRQFSKPNELTAPGNPVFLFGCSGKFWKVKTAFSDKDIVKINIGDSATVTFDAYPGLVFKASADMVGEISAPYTGTYDVELILAANERRLASGFTASIDLYPSEKKYYFLVPVESLLQADGGSGYIYTLKENMTVEKVRINIETIIGSKVAITGIPDGITEVVSGGVAYLKNGMRVEVIR